MTEFVRTYHIPRQEVCDFRAHLNMKLFQMPQSYRPNSSGAYTVIKNGAVDWVRKYRKWSEVEYTGDGDESDSSRHTRLAENGRVFEPSMNLLRDNTDWEKEFNEKRVAEQVIELMEALPEPERICLTFYYGLNLKRPLSLYLIARKMGVTVDWVQRRIHRGEFLLRRRVQRDALKVDKTIFQSHGSVAGSLRGQRIRHKNGGAWYYYKNEL
jgi:RNA polymerase sigma factor (sigma-70 family)